MAHFLELTRAGKHYAGVQALSEVDFSMSTGEIHCLIGENGSGKSTLIKIISGAEAPDPGARLKLGGHEIPFANPAASARQGIQVIYQDLALFPNLSVAENIAVHLNLRSPFRLHARRRQRAAARAALERVGVALPLD